MSSIQNKSWNINVTKNIRGPVSQDNFKDYITPLLYYKRISDVYDEETENALLDSGGDIEYASLPEQHRFVIPEGCRWQDIRERPENLGTAIVEAMRKIEVVFDNVARSLAFDEEIIKTIICNIKEIKGLIPGFIAECIDFFPGVDRTIGGWKVCKLLNNV